MTYGNQNSLFPSLQVLNVTIIYIFYLHPLWIFILKNFQQCFSWLKSKEEYRILFSSSLSFTVRLCFWNWWSIMHWNWNSAKHLKNNIPMFCMYRYSCKYQFLLIYIEWHFYSCQSLKEFFLKVNLPPSYGISILVAYCMRVLCTDAFYEKQLWKVFILEVNYTFKPIKS